jgi:hypothetical protein
VDSPWCDVLNGFAERAATLEAILLGPPEVRTEESRCHFWGSTALVLSFLISVCSSCGAIDLMRSSSSKLRADIRLFV